MGLDAAHKVFALTKISGPVKHVLTVLAIRANAENECWPSYETLAQDTGYSERTIIRAISSLIEIGFIIRTKKGGIKNKSSRYKLILPDRESGDRESGDRESGDRESGNQVTESHLTDRSGDRESGNQVTESHVKENKKESVRRKKEKKKDSANSGEFAADATAPASSSEDENDDTHISTQAQAPTQAKGGAKGMSSVSDTGEGENAQYGANKGHSEGDMETERVQGSLLSDSEKPATAQAKKLEGAQAGERKKKQLADYPSEYVDFARAYQAAMQERFARTAPTVTDALVLSCVETLDLAIRIDKFSLQEIRDALAWAYYDDFWEDKLKSLAQLRKKSERSGVTKLQNVVSAYHRAGAQKKPVRPGEWDAEQARRNTEQVLNELEKEGFFDD